jgi:exodeoxyribonuclease V alpha subunit
MPGRYERDVGQDSHALGTYLKRNIAMEQATPLETYLVDTRQIDALAKRQAAMICRCIDDEVRQSRASTVFLLALAALQRGSPRVERQELLQPVVRETIDYFAALYRAVNKKNAPWAAPLNADLPQIAAAIDDVLADPLQLAPVAGSAPAEPDGVWPVLVVENGHAGFSRYWSSARKLETRHIPALLNNPTEFSDTPSVAAALREVFMQRSEYSFHARQIAAAAMACRSRFLIISGGPGTGKTSVVLQILRTMLRVFPHITADRIVLCAPTGRAKARLGESINAGLDKLRRVFPEIGSSGALLDESLRFLHCKTLHSLLGQRPDGSFKYNREHPLPYEVVIIDEASMVDLNLFAALMEARTAECRIILAGDMHQLPSVDAGAVLGDLTGCFSEIPDYATLSKETGTWVTGVTGGIPADGGDDPSIVIPDTTALPAETRQLADHVIILTRSYRSVAAILHLARKVNRGDAEGALLLLGTEENSAGCSLETTARIEPVEQWIAGVLRSERIAQAYRIIGGNHSTGVASEEFVNAIKTVLFSSTVLTLVHDGPRGRKAINTLAEKLLREQLHTTSGVRFFHGLPVILGRNHHTLELYNGDLGMVIRTAEGMKAVFLRGNECRMFALDRLMDPEPAFALTVHKSQGSEFDSVLLVLPENESPLLSRQIIYTGITRAKNSIRILGSRDILRKAIITREQRSGGVRVGGNAAVEAGAS